MTAVSKKVWNGKGWRGPVEVICSKQGHPEVVFQDQVQTTFEYLTEIVTLQLLGNL